MAETTKPLAGKVAIVTGAGSGIGRAEALALAKAGAAIVVNDRASGATMPGGAEETIALIEAAGGKAVACYEDVSDFKAAGRIVQAAVDTFGRLDILVNNAGFARPALVCDMTEEQWDDVIGVHLKGQFNMVRHAAPILRAQRSGTIINTASESGLGHYGMSNYSAAKEGVVGFTRAIARELSQFNVRCNAIRPRAASGIGTPELFETIRYSQEVLKIATHGDRWVNLDEVNSPDMVGEFVVWLCTPASARANGRTFFVGGDTVSLYADPSLGRALVKPGGWTLADLNTSIALEVLLEGVEDKFRGTDPNPPIRGLS